METTVKYAVSVMISIALALTVSSGRAETDFPKKFHVDGNKIVDEAGQEMVFRGLIPIDPIYHAYASSDTIFHDPVYPPWGEGHARKMYEWGAKMISLSIHPAVWRAHGKDNCLAIIDQFLEYATKYNMYVYIDYHSIGYPMTGEYESLSNYFYGEMYETTQAEIKDFWDVVSDYYKDNNVVAFYELFNEPVFAGFTQGASPYHSSTQDWIGWKEFAEEVIDVIRANDPDSVIMVGGMDWAYDISYAADYPVEREGIVYSTHPYPDSNWRKTWDAAFGNVKERYPVFATEFGFSIDSDKPESDYSGPGRYRDAIRLYLENKKISWTAWCFSYIWTPALLADINYTPSEPGEFFRGWLYEYSGLDPLPDIKVNGSDDSIAVNSGDRVSVTVSLIPGRYRRANADWWLYADTPRGPYYYEVKRRSGRWKRGSAVTHQGPLFNLPTIEVLNISGLPTGTYTIHFEVDMSMNGLQDSPTYSDTVIVNIE